MKFSMDNSGNSEVQLQKKMAGCSVLSLRGEMNIDNI